MRASNWTMDLAPAFSSTVAMMRSTLTASDCWLESRRASASSSEALAAARREAVSTNCWASSGFMVFSWCSVISGRCSVASSIEVCEYAALSRRSTAAPVKTASVMVQILAAGSAMRASAISYDMPSAPACRRRSRTTSGKSRAKRKPEMMSAAGFPPGAKAPSLLAGAGLKACSTRLRGTMSAEVMMTTLRRASWPSKLAVKSRPMPSRDGMARSAAARLRMTRCPREPAGARSLGTSTSVSTPRKARRLGWRARRGMASAMESS